METLPWLTIIGWGESGIDGISKTSLEALAHAEVIFGSTRHIELLPELNGDVVEWPVPFSEGVDLVLQHKGKQVVVLASGDPFWFGAGTVLANNLSPHEWQAFPAQSCFSLAASAIGWGLENVECIGLHAKKNLFRMRRYLFQGNKILALLRDGEAVAELQVVLNDLGFGQTKFTILESLGGKRQKIRSITVNEPLPDGVCHPVMVALEVFGVGMSLPLTGGLPDHLFEHDGQITKQNIRAITLSALAPKPGEELWDIGAGSGSVSIEWLLADKRNKAVALERISERVERIKRNAINFGVDWLEVVEGSVPEMLDGRETPDAVFIGGGLSSDLLEALWSKLSAGTRIVANAVTLESEALLTSWSKKNGGDLLRIELSTAKAIGKLRGWESVYPIVQWRVTR